MTILFLAIIVMMAIYGFSSQNGSASSQLSEGVTRRLAQLFIPGFQEKDAKEQTETIARLHFYVRKMGHMIEYAALGFLATAFLLTFPVADSRAWLIALVVCLCYAALDEWHQGFVAGRSPGVTDVLIDGTGAALGAGFYLLVRKMRRRFLKKRAA